MALEKITDRDLAGKGVFGQPDVPGLSAEEMQRKVEEIVRDVAIVKINEIITWLLESGVSKTDLEKLLIDVGAVSSVFGRAGDVMARKGDYTAEMVGAAAEKHAAQHGKNGADPLTPGNIGAATEEHKHGNIKNDGKIGDKNGMVIMTGLDGILEAKGKDTLGFVDAPTDTPQVGSVAITLQNNRNYYLEDVTNLSFTYGGDKKVSCHGWIEFSTPGTIEIKNFDFVEDPEEITEAQAGSLWEFDLEYGCLIIRKRSA